MYLFMCIFLYSSSLCIDMGIYFSFYSFISLYKERRNFFWSICPLKKYYQFESEKSERWCTNSSNFASIEILDYKSSEVIHKMFTLSFIYKICIIVIRTVEMCRWRIGDERFKTLKFLRRYRCYPRFDFIICSLFLIVMDCWRNY